MYAGAPIWGHIRRPWRRRRELAEPSVCVVPFTLSAKVEERP